MNIRDLREVKGSRPPPQNAPRTQAISIFLILGLVIAAAYATSGYGEPVDPNGPGGPPTLEPYFNASDYGQQQIVMPSSAARGADNNLQLKTFSVEGCGTQNALYFVIDTSGSMAYEGKLQKEQTALQQFISKLGGKTVMGMETFSKDVKYDVPMNYYNNNKADLTKAIKGLKADGWTRTRDAMQMAEDNISTSIKENDFPGYSYSLILMTDGVPEVPPDQPRTCYVTYPDPNTAPALRCFAQEQDPTVPTNIPLAIKQLKVDIYSVNIYSPSYASDKFMYPYLKKLLTGIASDPADTHYYESIGGSDLNKILSKICDPGKNEVGAPSAPPIDYYQ